MYLARYEHIRPTRKHKCSNAERGKLSSEIPFSTKAASVRFLILGVVEARNYPKLSFTVNIHYVCHSNSKQTRET